MLGEGGVLVLVAFFVKLDLLCTALFDDDHGDDDEAGRLQAVRATVPGMRTSGSGHQLRCGAWGARGLRMVRGAAVGLVGSPGSRVGGCGGGVVLDGVRASVSLVVVPRCVVPLVLVRGRYV